MSGPAVTPRVRWAAVGTVLTLAAVAAFMSYGHLRAVAESQGEDAAALFPISVDGLIVAASLVLLVQRRGGQPGGVLPWAGLLLGIAATIAGNVASAEPTAVARLVAAWPPVAFALSYEFLLSLLRPPTQSPASAVAAADPVTEVPPATFAQVTEVPSPAVVPPRAAELPAPAGDQAPTADPAGDPLGHPVSDQLGDPLPAAAAAGGDLAARIAAVLRQADEGGYARPGRKRLATLLGTTEHAIRTAPRVDATTLEEVSR